MTFTTTEYESGRRSARERCSEFDIVPGVQKMLHIIYLFIYIFKMTKKKKTHNGSISTVMNTKRYSWEISRGIQHSRMCSNEKMMNFWSVSSHFTSLLLLTSTCDEGFSILFSRISENVESSPVSHSKYCIHDLVTLFSYPMV